MGKRQALLQASSLSAFPSSHSSTPFTTPSPQTKGAGAGAGAPPPPSLWPPSPPPPSVIQIFEQPSPLTTFPSSQVSAPSITLLPQIAGTLALTLILSANTVKNGTKIATAKAVPKTKEKIFRCFCIIVFVIFSKKYRPQRSRQIKQKKQ